MYYLLCQVIGQTLQGKYKCPNVKVYSRAERTFSKRALGIFSTLGYGKEGWGTNDFSNQFVYSGELGWRACTIRRGRTMSIRIRLSSYVLKLLLFHSSKNQVTCWHPHLALRANIWSSCRPILLIHNPLWNQEARGRGICPKGLWLHNESYKHRLGGLRRSCSSKKRSAAHIAAQGRS